MFETNLEMDEEGMTVPYPSLFDEVRKKYGFVDVRERPDLAAEIAESTQSSTMRNLLVALAQPHSNLFTIGCDLGTKFVSENEFPNIAGGYIQIMSAAYAKPTPEDYARFAQAVSKALEVRSEDHEWKVYFVLKPVRFNLDNFSEMTGSLWIWFHALAATEQKALSSRETLIFELGRSLTREVHVALFEAGVVDA
jgi:hypothetical protein